MHGWTKRLSARPFNARTLGVMGGAALALCGALSGCVTATHGPDTSVSTAQALSKMAETMPSGGLVQNGIEALLDERPTDAAQAFSQALKTDPENPHLHFLNALAYHLGYVRGIHGNKDLAETGYLVALRLAPAHPYASAMLGQLYLDTSRYQEAQNLLSQSYFLGQDSQPTMVALASASYQINDFKTAVWAVDKAEGQADWSPELARTSALVHAAAGDFATADNRIAIYQTLDPLPQRVRAARKDVEMWRRTYQRLELAQAAPATTVPDIAATDAPAVAQQGAAAGTDGTPSKEPVSRDWSACDQAALDLANTYLNIAVNADTALTTLTTNEASPLPPLPSPCKDVPQPRMTVIDTVIIRTQDASSTNKGVNLLDGLQVTLGGNLIDYSRVRTSDPAQYSQVNNNLTVSFPTSDSAVTYNLNIANATDTSSEVIARPSLVALDRQASTFFSGTNLSTVTTGQYGGNGVDHQAGVSLSVTPTFIDDDSMLLAVKAARSFFEGTTSLSSTVPSSRSVVQANVRIRYGQTLVLSGLNERENQGSDTGVPVLRDIPIVQYLFRNKSTEQFNKSVLILLTPRKIAPDTGADDAAQPVASSQDTRDLREMADPIPALEGNLEMVEAELSKNSPMFRTFKTADLKSQLWTRPSEMGTLIDDLIGLMWF